MDRSDYESAYRNRRWAVRYTLAYDGGGEAFTHYYRTKIGARVAKFWHKHISSWGGTAFLFENKKKETQ